MRGAFLGERGSASFFALCFLCAAVAMVSGLLYIARQGESTIRHHEEELQLLMDAESSLEKAVAGIEEKGLGIEEEIPVGGEVFLPQESNERGTNIRTMVKRDDTGIYVISVAENPGSQAAAFKSAQGFLTKQEGRYAWKCWVH